MIITSLVGFSLRVLSGKIIPQFKVSLNAFVDGLQPHDVVRTGDLLTVESSCERLRFEPGEKSSRAFMALVNYATDQVIVEEVSVEEKVTNKKFQMFLRARGKNKLRVFVFRGDGQIDSSFYKEVSVA